jgi:hypothetical protein
MLRWVIEFASIEKQPLGQYHVIRWCPHLYNAYANLKYLAKVQILGSVPPPKLQNFP